MLFGLSVPVNVRELYSPFHAVARPLEDADVGVLEHPVDRRTCEHGIAEDLRPFVDVAVARDNHRRVVLSSVEEIEDLLAHVSWHANDTPVVEDPELGRQDLFKENVEHTSLLRASDLGAESFHARTEDAVPGLCCSYANGDREMALACTGRAEQERYLVAVDELEIDQALDALSRKLRVKIPVELLKRPPLGEVGFPDPPLDGVILSRIELPFEKLREPLHVFYFSLGKDALDLGRGLRETKVFELVSDRVYGHLFSFLLTVRYGQV